jgi:hypothetical protein
MPARDRYHDVVVAALTDDGWTITDDPLYLGYGDRPLYVDLGAEKTTLAAEKEGQRIAVEIKSFLSKSAVDDLEVALGQYNLYRDVLADTEPERVLYLAIPNHAWEGIFSERLGRLVIERQQLRLIVFDAVQGGIIKWIN